MTEGVRVLKSGICTSLSGRARIGYDIGRCERRGVMIRVTSNSRPGRFNGDWVRWRFARSALVHIPSGKPVRVGYMANLFKGSSRNTVYFVGAVLKHEGLLRRSTTYREGYDLVSEAALNAWERTI